MMPTLSPLFTWRGAVVSSDLSPHAKLVALCLSLHMNERGSSAFPSRKTLALESSLDVRTITRQTAHLVEMGWLMAEDRYDSTGRETSRLYRATVPAARYLQPVDGTVGCQ